MTNFFKPGEAGEVYCAIRDGINDRCREAHEVVESMWLDYQKYDTDLPSDAPSHLGAALLGQGRFPLFSMV